MNTRSTCLPSKWARWPNKRNIGFALHWLPQLWLRLLKQMLGGRMQLVMKRYYNSFNLKNQFVDIQTNWTKEDKPINQGRNNGLNKDQLKSLEVNPEGIQTNLAWSDSLCLSVKAKPFGWHFIGIPFHQVFIIWYVPRVSSCLHHCVIAENMLLN